MPPTSASNQLLKSSLLEHEGLLLSFATRVVAGGDLERLVDLLETNSEDDGDISSRGSRHGNNAEKKASLQQEAGQHRKAMMELAVQLDHFRKCKEELDSLDAKDASQVEALLQRIQTGPDADGGRDEATFEVQMAEALGIALDDPNQDGKEEMELTIVGGDGSNADTFKYRCPITTKLLDDPVTNIVCGHAYSKQAILQHLRVAKGKQCPVAGCRTVNISPSHLKHDIKLTQLVRRQKRREDAAQESRQISQAMAMMEDEEGDDDDDDMHYKGAEPVIKQSPGEDSH